MPLLALIAGYLVVILIGALGAIVIAYIVAGRIDLSSLLSEEDGKASFSRFQFLVFTFVIAMCVLVLTLEGGKFPDLGADVLGLIGISGSGYVISKGIQKSAEAAQPPKTAPPTPGVDSEERR
jgi:energy-converting hydrogenase Eha subunit A